MDESTKKSFQVIGQFISACGTFEFYVNHMVKQQFLSETLIDRVENLPIKDRWRIVKESVEPGMLMEMDDGGVSIQDKISEIDSIIQYYGNRIKPIRDMLAHSPLLEYNEGEPQIMNARRHKLEGKDYLQLEVIEKTFESFEENLDRLMTASLGFGVNGLGWQRANEVKPEDRIPQ